jgi:hypothetical protein
LLYFSQPPWAEEKTNQMERLNRSTSFNQASVFAVAPIKVDENWIMEQLFGIRALEKKIAFHLANSNGRRTTSIRRDVAELQARLAGFDQVLDCDRHPNSARALGVRAS